MIRQRIAFVLIGSAVVVALGGCSYGRLSKSDQERAADAEACAPCLSADMDLSTSFADSPNTIDGRAERRVITMKQKLIQIGAHCEAGVIYDSEGRPVFFRRMTELGIRLDDDARRRLKEEKKELDKLAAQGTLIRMWRQVPAS